MARKRHSFDPLATSTKPRWLTQLDAHNRLVDVRELPPGTNLREALHQRLMELQGSGWVIEGVAYSGTFIHRDAMRHYVAVYPSNPSDQPISMHGAYPGSHR